MHIPFPLPEQRIREGSFYLGVDRSGALNDHAHVENFMHKTALEIIEQALAAADAAGDDSSDDGGAGGGAGGAPATDVSDVELTAAAPSAR